MPTKGCGDIDTGPVLDTRNQRIEYSSTLSYHHSMVQLYFINYYIIVMIIAVLTYSFLKKKCRSNYVFILTIKNKITNLNNRTVTINTLS